MAAYMQRRARNGGAVVQCHHPRLEQLMDIEVQCLPLVHKREASTPEDEAGLWQDLELGSTFASVFQVGSRHSSSPPEASCSGETVACTMYGIQQAVATSRAFRDIVLNGSNCPQPAVMLHKHSVDAGAGQGGSAAPRLPERGRPGVAACFSG